MIEEKIIEFSIIVPVYNRPDEVAELLESLSKQTNKDFEVVIVEDGSTISCEAICQNYLGSLNLVYLKKPNSGRSETRNFGMAHATGNYYIIFDSDCIIPPTYLETVSKHLSEKYVDCYGGPDSADASFTDMQKAINYSMTSFMTTGGIRGATKKTDSFSPRSFNMGVSQQVFQTIGGFKNMIGEDIDFSFRVKEAQFTTTLFQDAYVFHKRRVDLKKFFRQVNTFGKARVLLSRMHPHTLKLVHLLPATFVVGNIILFLLCIWSCWFLLPIGLYVIGLFTESLIKNKKIKIAFMSIATAYIQLFGYGLGFINEIFTNKATKTAQEKLYK